mmetsp:Transcript_16016/g.30221  ORF Transcript_16016/g.30221 Transcript_16016/m.30221 type:complete len:668 (-) Transcript_16016:52-2055(-)
MNSSGGNTERISNAMNQKSSYLSTMGIFSMMQISSFPFSGVSQVRMVFFILPLSFVILYYFEMKKLIIFKQISMGGLDKHSNSSIVMPGVPESYPGLDQHHSMFLEEWNKILENRLHEDALNTATINAFGNESKGYYQKSKKIRNYLLNMITAGKNMSEIDEMFQIFPPPRKGSNVIEIYNRMAYGDLIKTIMTKKDNFVICANGGSATAGGGGVGRRQRYFVHLAKYMSSILQGNQDRSMSSPTNTSKNADKVRIKVIDQGHGNRHSLHSAMFSPNFLTDSMDLILWEFAINDYGYHLPNASRISQERSILSAWLEEVKLISSNSPPPKVILVYLWKAPFQLDEFQQKISNPVFLSHNRMAKEYDFVIGHVNVASYLDDLPLSFDETKQLFLADGHHPNHLGHLTISYLLVTMLQGKEEYFVSTNLTDHKKTSTASMWFCGNETWDKRFVQSQVIQQQLRENAAPGEGQIVPLHWWRSPQASWTMELPQNELAPVTRRQIIAENIIGVHSMGKIDKLRKDRQRSIEVACCETNIESSTATNYITSNTKTFIAGNFTTLRVADYNYPLKKVKSVFLGFAKNMSNISNLKVRVNQEARDEQGTFLTGKLIKVPHDWECFWTWEDVYDSQWFIFPEIQDRLFSFQVCVENNQCVVNNDSGVALISISVY